MQFVYLLVIFILFIIYIKHKKLSLMKVNVLFTFVILITLLITSMDLSGLQQPLKYSFINLILLCLVLFWIGSKIKFTGERDSNNDNRYRYNSRSTRLMIYIIWFLVVLGFVITVVKLGVPPLLSGVNRSDYFVSIWGSFYLLQSVLMALILFDHYNQKSINNITMFIIIGSILVMTILMSNKYQIIYIILLFLITRDQFVKKIKMKDLIKPIILIIIIFIIFYNYVYTSMYGVSVKDMMIGYKMKIPSQLSFLTPVYLYISFNFDNLQHYIFSAHSLLYGTKTFDGIFSFLFLNKSFLASNMSSTWTDLLRIKSMTTGSVFADFAQDFGIIGMILFSFTTGIWSGFWERRYKATHNFSSFYIYTSVLCAIFLSFFTNSFFSKITIINIVAALIIGKVMKLNMRFR